MNIKYNIKELMIDNNISLNQMARETDLSINTIRKYRNSTEYNPQLNTLSILAKALGCNIKDLFDEESWISFYNIIVDKRKENPLFKNQQFFSLDNIALLKRALSSIGIVADYKPSLSLTTLSIKNEPGHAPVYFDLNLRVNMQCLEIIDFYIYVNLEVLKEEIIKTLIVKTLERYAKQKNIDKIIFYNLDGTDSTDSYNYYCEINLLNPTYQCNPKINVKVLKDRGYTLWKSPFLPGNLGDQWIKKLDIEK